MNLWLILVLAVLWLICQPIYWFWRLSELVLRWLVHSLGTSGLICALLPIQIIYTILCAQQSTAQHSTHTITQTKKKDKHFWEYSGEVCSDLRSAGKPVELNTLVTSIAVCLFVCLFVCLLHHLHCSLACYFAHLISRCIWSASAVLSASCRQSKPISVHCGGWEAPVGVLQLLQWSSQSTISAAI